MGRLNHRGWIVLVSIPSDDAAMCVDFFEDADGCFGFEHFRVEAEDHGRHTPIGGFAATRYDTPTDAINQARKSVAWLERHVQAKKSLDAWQSNVGEGRS